MAAAASSLLSSAPSSSCSSGRRRASPFPFRSLSSVSIITSSSPFSARSSSLLSMSPLPGPTSAPAATASTAFSVSASAEKKKALIVNTNSGGHAVIGFYLAKELLGAGHDVTVLTVGEESSDKMKKPPFTRFSELVSAGGSTVWGNPADVGKIVGGAAFDVVLDNNGKDLDSVRPVADWAKAAGVKQFLYISSAGIYKTSDEVPHVEGIHID